MDLYLEGKAALVTGGSAGIGLACARGLVGEGVDVAIAGRSPERLAAAAAELEAVAANRARTPTIVTIAADLSQAGDVTRAAAEARATLGRVDILVNNAGSAMGGPFFDLGDEAFLAAWTLKLLGSSTSSAGPRAPRHRPSSPAARPTPRSSTSPGASRRNSLPTTCGSTRSRRARPRPNARSG
jgi:NAD(P)-dependent dehydrogenase (short-subunit alcohol dehydrogenase family)